MADLPPLREVVARHGLSASKALGQNFLFDEQLLDRLAAVPGDLAGKAVLEIGPGPGGLTRALLRAGARVTAVEMDRRCLPALAELADAYPDKLRVVEGDALKLDHDALMGEPYAIVSNDVIDFASMQRLTRFSRFWDIVANSGRYPRTLPVLLAEAPFDRFMAFSDWLYGQVGQSHGIARERLVHLLHDVHRPRPPHR